tara:strand:+ start:1827 stop:2480 length:654 start_codon:yes stop_codon:yes gene_type:complete
MSIGSVFKSSHQYEKTNKISKLALNNALHLNSPSENINSIYIHVARSYYDLEEYDSSKYYFEKALNVLASSDYYKNHINNYLTSIKVNEGKYIEAIEELNLLIKTFEMNQDTINILLSLQNILTPLKKIDEIEDLNANIEKIKLYIDNYTLSSEQLMSIHWVISQVLRQTNIKASEYHKNRAIFNMNEFIKMFNSVEDKNLLISNHKTIKEIKTFAN